jgi:NADH dehydrogenase
MKSVSESLYLRNQLLEMLEEAANGSVDITHLNIAVVGGGPTGVELCGALAEMRKHVFPRDYPGLDFAKMRIILLEGSDKILGAMDPKSSERAAKYLHQLGVEVVLNVRAKSFENKRVMLDNGDTADCRLLLWAAGIKPNTLAGLPPGAVLPNGRILTDKQLKVRDTENVYCIGDQALVPEKRWEKGHPQMAQPAIQQGDLFARNLLRKLAGKSTADFTYKDLGTMATVGRNLAVAEVFGLKLGGFVAWFIWMAIHLMAILGVKNKLFIFINWLWSYMTYDQSLRLLIKPYKKKSTAMADVAQ